MEKLSQFGWCEHLHVNPIIMQMNGDSVKSGLLGFWHQPDSFAIYIEHGVVKIECLVCMQDRVPNDLRAMADSLEVVRGTGGTPGPASPHN